MNLRGWRGPSAGRRHRALGMQLWSAVGAMHAAGVEGLAGRAKLAACSCRSRARRCQVEAGPFVAPPGDAARGGNQGSGERPGHISPMKSALPVGSLYESIDRKTAAVGARRTSVHPSPGSIVTTLNLLWASFRIICSGLGGFAEGEDAVTLEMVDVAENIAGMRRRRNSRATDSSSARLS